MTKPDEFYMRQALQLARKAVGQTSPNPAVGALLVKNSVIIGRGYHRRAGGAHAEIEALRRAGKHARGATLYVSLEPCNHIGRTGPCCGAILDAGIRRVVAAVKDPNPITNGRGIKRLRQAGLSVTTGVLADEARGLNSPFFKVMERGLPFVLVKLAQSLDGKSATASGESQWISSPASRQESHRWRSQADAVLVGVNTVIADNPRLTARLADNSRQPVRIILDSRLRTPLTARCLRPTPRAAVWIATILPATHPRAKALIKRGAAVISSKPDAQGRVALEPLFRQLARRGVQSILIEGGPETIASALRERLVDRVAFFIAPIILGGKGASGAVGGEGIKRLARAIQLQSMTTRRVGDDLCVEADVLYPNHSRKSR